MKRFRYSLDTVLDYKAQVLDNLKTEHALILRDVNQKKAEIVRLKNEMHDYQIDFDETKRAGTQIENYRLFDLCIGQMERQIDEEKEKLSVLKKKEEKKKEEVVTAKIDTSKFEKLKDKRLQEYHKAELKEEESFTEEFVTRGITTAKLRVSARRG